VIRRLRARAKHALDWRVQALAGRLERLDGRLDAIEARLEAVQARLEGIADDGFTIRGRLDRELVPLLRAIVAEETGNRRRLDAARAEPSYGRPYDDPDPLVSILIATRERPRLLVERSIASALAQTHANLEVVVAGDAAPPAVEAAVRGVGDPRVRWANTTHRVVDVDPHAHWLVASTLPRNLAYALARGSWLVDLDDDDALRPDAVERLLGLARAERLEVAYGPVLAHAPDGSAQPLGVFPPRAGDFHWQGALLHASLRFFERELVAATLGLPGDIYRIERMLRAGARVGFTPEVVCDFYPSSWWGPRASVEPGEDAADAVDVGDPHRLVEREREQ
jgi:hypothetical protein